MSEIVNETDEVAIKTIPRLCNEIQLFDLCEKERCSLKSGRFCTDADLLSRFEAIEERQERKPEPDDDQELFEEEEIFDEEYADDDDETYYDDDEYIDQEEE